jgi:hypothetical protein
MKKSELTPRQADLLRRLPDAPNDGRRVKGGQFVIARNLADQGYARCVGWNHHTNAHYFVRTEAGNALISGYDEKRKATSNV